MKEEMGNTLWYLMLCFTKVSDKVCIKPQFYLRAIPRILILQSSDSVISFKHKTYMKYTMIPYCFASTGIIQTGRIKRSTSFYTLVF